jgi:hypothetical protein
MTMKPVGSERFSLARWSRRKLASALDKPVASPAPAAAAAPATVPSTPAAELPPVESLSFDSDFTAFLKPGVDPTVKRAALKKLFRDPRFNVMDGLDIYIDDYTKADPIPGDVLADLLDRFNRSHATSAGDPEPATVGAAAASEARFSAAATAPLQPAIEPAQESAQGEGATDLAYPAGSKSSIASPPTPTAAAETVPSRDSSGEQVRLEPR